MRLCFMLLTCCIWEGVRVPGVLAAVDMSMLQSQFHSVRERSVTNPVGGAQLHQVDIPWLQPL